MHTGSQSGQSLIEVLLAIAVFLIGTITVGYLIIDAQATLRMNIEFTEARLLAREGIDATRSIRDRSFSELTSGVHGLALVDNAWEFVPDSDQDGLYERTITIEEIDPDMRKIISQVRWGISPREHRITFTTYLSDWMQTGGAAGNVHIDITDATLSASGTELTGVWLSNESSDDLVIAGMKVQWEGDSTLTNITVGESDIFTAATSSGALSGELIDVTDYLVVGDAGYVPVDVIGFDGEVSNSDILITFIMDDESEQHVLISLNI